MKAKGGCVKSKKKVHLNDIDIDPSINEVDKCKITKLLQKYNEVFSNNPDSLPRPMKGIPQHSFKIKEGVKPVYCRRPYWGPQTRKYLTQWTDWALEEGLIEPAPEASWASRIVIAPKYRGDTAKSDVPDDLRVCVDFTAVNANIEKMVPTYPDPYAQMRRAAGFKWYFSADGLKQFWSIMLARESRDLTSVWTPRGLMRFTRLIMGTSNASTIAQNHYAAAMQKHIRGNLADGTPIIDRVFNFQDDFLLAANDLSEMRALLDSFMRMCALAGIQINPAKTHLTSGHKGAQFYGFKVSYRGISPAEKNLDPIRKMTAPKDLSGVRAVLGVFNQFRSFVERYDRVVKPIQKLVKKHAKFEWNEDAERAMQDMRQRLMKGDLYLRVQDPRIQLQLETDASDDGWGAILYQMIGGEKKILCMWSKQWTIAMSRMPAYYRETKAWMLGVEKARIYADYNHHPLLCWTDHIPLTYIKHTSGKGPVSQFHLDHLSDITYEIRYRKGTEIAADHISRYPLLGPKKLGGEGKKQATQALLLAIPGTHRQIGRTWVYAGKETESVRSLVDAWRTQRASKETRLLVTHTQRPTRANMKTKTYDWGVWIPEAEHTQDVLKQAFDRNIPFACLMPSGLIGALRLDQETALKLQVATKVVLLRPEMVWIVHGVEGTKHRVMAAWGVQSFLSALTDTSAGIEALQPLNWEDKAFIASQKAMTKVYESDKLVTREDGFMIYKPDAETNLVVVPEDKAKEITNWQHKRMCHAGHAKVHAELSRHFHWPNMRRQMKRWIQECAGCQLLKAKRKHAHGYFRANVQHKPRTSYAMDFYGVGESKQGYNNILGIIDLATSELVLCPTKDRKAGTVAECLLQRVFLKKGCPANIHSDHAREFIAKAVKRLCAVMGCRRTTTLAHHPTGNATIERAWQYVTLVLRNTTESQYERWETLVSLWEHAWNNTIHTLLGVTPFEAAHGLPAVSAVETLASTPITNTEGMTKDSINALKVAAKANMQAIALLRQHDKQARANKANNTRARQSFKVGDRVKFYIPPTGAAKLRKSNRKSKHILQYRGPAVITKVRTPTTYDLDYKGKQYSRATAELRPYKGTQAPTVVFPENSLQDKRLKKGQFVAYLEMQEDTHFHIGKVRSTGDSVTIQAYATTSPNLKHAQWKPLLQITKSQQYTLKVYANRVQVQVEDEIPTGDASTLIVAKGLKMLPSNKLDKKSRATMQLSMRQHHRLGHTFP
jgi:transposase InsO family protein